MTLDPLLSLAGLVVGLLVGLSGMGGGALLTPLLVLGFGTAPLVAVGSDLLTALFMKPVGAAVHLRHGAVDRRLVALLCAGSVPSAFLGVVVLSAHTGPRLEEGLKVALGVMLLLSAALMLVKPVLLARPRTRESFHHLDAHPPLRPVATLAIGVVGGLCVGVTSVGSGSLMIVLLMLVYPGMTARSLVGTDLLQAVPLVASATLGHLLFGQVELGLTASLLLGALPGVYVGARLSARTSTTFLRRVLVLVLTASGLKLVGTPLPLLAVLVVLLTAGALPVWARMGRVLQGWRTAGAARGRAPVADSAPRPRE